MRGVGAGFYIFLHGLCGGFGLLDTIVMMPDQMFCNTGIYSANVFT
jgi:hypothetical protein